MYEKIDRLYAEQLSSTEKFCFDEQVAAVFPDMIKRSVPGYNHIISVIGMLAEQYAQANSLIYDLGCSLGAATLAMRQRLQTPNIKIIAVDNSEAMLARSADYLDAQDSVIPVSLKCQDITKLAISNCSFAVLNFTLQFIACEQRLAVLQTIYQGMRPGGALVLSEKLSFADPLVQARLEQHHHDFKRANGYSILEISQKRQALEQVLLPETAAAHSERLQQAGFAEVTQWFQSFNFASFIAIK